MLEGAVEADLRLDEAAEAVVGAEEREEVGGAPGVLHQLAVGGVQHVLLAGLLSGQGLEVPVKKKRGRSIPVQCCQLPYFIATLSIPPPPPLTCKKIACEGGGQCSLLLSPLAAGPSNAVAVL